MKTTIRFLVAAPLGVGAAVQAGEAPQELSRLFDAFFDAVRVLDDDEAVRANRVALLQGIGELFGHTADISRLQDQ